MTDDDLPTFVSVAFRRPDRLEVTATCDLEQAIQLRTLLDAHIKAMLEAARKPGTLRLRAK